MTEITEAQTAVLDIINSFIKEHGYSPSVREIADEYGCTIKGALDFMRALEKKGYITWVKNTARTIKILKETGW